MVDHISQRKPDRIPPVLNHVNQFVDCELHIRSRQRFARRGVCDNINAIPQREPCKTLPPDKPGEWNPTTGSELNGVDVGKRQVFGNMTSEALR